MPTILPNGKNQFIDLNGRPLVGGKVFYYEPGTETFKDTYADLAGTIVNENPITLDGRGQATICGTGAYRQVTKDKDGALIWDEEVSELSQGLEGSDGATQIGFIQVGVGAVKRTVQDKLREVISITDFGASPNIDDNSDALAKWFQAVKDNNLCGYIPGNTYKFLQQISLDLAGLGARGIKIYGDGQQATMLDVTAVKTSPAVMLTKSDQTDGFYTKIEDLGIRGNLPGTLLQLGRTDHTDPFNAVRFNDVWLGNNDLSAACVVAQLEYVLGLLFFNVVAAGGGKGDAWQLNAAEFCTWIGGAGTWADYGVHIQKGVNPFGTVAGNRFIGVDYEECHKACVRNDNPDGYANKWDGGTFVYHPGTTVGYDGVAGNGNVIDGVKPFAYPDGTVGFSSFLGGKSGIALRNMFGLRFADAPSNPVFNAYLTAPQPVSPGIWTKVNATAIDFQNGNSYDPAQQRFTCAVPGVHEFMASVEVTATNTSLATHQVAIYRNGSLLRRKVANVNTGSNTITVDIEIQTALSVGDYVECWVNLGASSGSPTIGGGSSTSYFSGRYIG